MKKTLRHCSIRLSLSGLQFRDALNCKKLTWESEILSVFNLSHSTLEGFSHPFYLTNITLGRSVCNSIWSVLPLAAERLGLTREWCGVIAIVIRVERYRLTFWVDVIRYHSIRSLDIQFICAHFWLICNFTYDSTHVATLVRIQDPQQFETIKL